jgi:hypothetical protein
VAFCGPTLRDVTGLWQRSTPQTTTEVGVLVQVHLVSMYKYLYLASSKLSMDAWNSSGSEFSPRPATDCSLLLMPAAIGNGSLLDFPASSEVWIAPWPTNVDPLLEVFLSFPLIDKGVQCVYKVATEESSSRSRGVITSTSSPKLSPSLPARALRFDTQNTSVYLRCLSASGFEYRLDLV